MRAIHTISALSLLLASANTAAQQAKPEQQTGQSLPLYKQANAPTEARVQDLLGRMTLEEKVAQLQTRSTFPPFLPTGKDPAFGIVKRNVVDEAIAKRSLGNGMGVFMVMSLGPTSGVENATELNAIQSWVMSNTRLGIPLMFMSEALHGAVLTGATSYPQGIALGSTWNRGLVKLVFSATSKELRTSGISLALAPVFDLARDPRYGRVEESYSEDPYLVGELGVQAVRGLQGDTGAIGPDHVISTAKHYVHGQPENGTNVGPNDFSERTMRDTFLAPFEKAVRAGRIGAVMSSYNESNGGLPGSADPWLLKTVLRGEWGFEGLVVSDFSAIRKMHDEQGLAGSVDEAGQMAFKAGVTVELPSGEGFPALLDATKAGRISETEIDAAVGRVLTMKFKAGLFENPYADIKSMPGVVGSKAHALLARKAADQAPVLLRNEGGLLPLDPAKIKTLAVIGPNASRQRLGGYSTSKPPYFVTVLDGIKKRLGGKVTVSFAEGVQISGKDTDDGMEKVMPYIAPSRERDDELIRQAVETARNADTVVLVLGGNEVVSREAFSGILGPVPSLGDSDDLELPGRQNELVREIMKLGKPTVAVLLNGRPYSIQQLSQSVPAILEGWYLGQETGNSVAGILFGDTNPSGRLPVTIARNAGQLPVYYYKTPTARIGYVFNDNKPLYPFGYGLSYTSFTYDKPVLDRSRIARDGTATVSVRVTNSGTRVGAEVVQMYVRPRVSSVVQPVMRLAGFERVELAPGKSATVSFPVGPEQLAIWDSRMQRSVEPGKVDVMIGPNSAKTEAVQLDVVRLLADRHSGTAHRHLQPRNR